MQSILDKYGIKVDYDTILTCWNESHRHYHNLDHLYSLLEKIGSESTPGSNDYDKLVLCALFHDIVYNPASSTNEEDSADLLIKWSEDPKNPTIQEVKDMILATKDHVAKTPLQEKFNTLDMSVVTDGNWDELVKWEEGISKEYIPVVGEEIYREGRRKFLESMADKYVTRSNMFYKLIEEVL
jgi:predicted metal-dependent HD superfamily phosphohydrolase